MASSKVEEILKTTLPLDCAPELIADADDPQYCDPDIARQSCTMSLVRSMIDQAGNAGLPVWAMQILAVASISTAPDLHLYVHDELFFKIYEQQASALAMSGSKTREALVASFPHFDGLWEGGKNPGWKAFVAVFMQELAKVTIDSAFNDYAPAGYPACKRDGPMTPTDSARARSFAKEFKQLDCWERWLHRHFRCNNDNSSKSFTALSVKADMFRKRPDKKDYKLDYSSWPIRHATLFPQTPIQWELIDESLDELTEEQAQEYSRWRQHNFAG